MRPGVGVGLPFQASARSFQSSLQMLFRVCVTEPVKQEINSSKYNHLNKTKNEEKETHDGTEPIKEADIVEAIDKARRFPDIHTAERSRCMYNEASNSAHYANRYEFLDNLLS